jgi:hypothetical protein
MATTILKSKNKKSNTKTNKITSKKIEIKKEIISSKDTKKVVEKKQRRKRRTKEEMLADPTNNRMYFTQNTENAIIKYNNTDDWGEKNKLYEQHIKYPFEKLAENILNTFKFSYFQVSSLDVQKEVVSFLVSNIHKFAEGRGKAFSYFSVVAKNYLILNNNSNYKNFKNNVDIDENNDKFIVTEKEYKHIDNIKEFLDIMIKYWEDNIPHIFEKKKECDIAFAIMELFRQSYKLENFNKKAIYIYIREMTDCKTNCITKVINKMKNIQELIYEDYLNHGTILHKINSNSTFFE